jgi:hypothetical protein
MGVRGPIADRADGVEMGSLGWMHGMALQERPFPLPTGTRPP